MTNGVVYGRYRVFIKEADGSAKNFEIWSGSWLEGYCLIAHGELSPEFKFESLTVAYKKRIPPAVIRELERRLPTILPN